MGIRTWLYKRTGIQLKTFGAGNKSDLSLQNVPEKYRLFSKAERYVAFLNTYLPLLRNKTLTVPDAERTKSAVFAHTLEEIRDKTGFCLEFGVYQGTSITQSAHRYPDRHFYGFDSFEGLPNDGRKDWNHDFSLTELPNVPSNASLIKGWFANTLPAFLEKNPATPIAFLNIDCDIYSSTVDVFTALEQHKKLEPGIVIYFAELVNYADLTNPETGVGYYFTNEILALFEMLERTGLGIEWLYCHDQVRAFPQTMDLLESQEHPEWKANLEQGYHPQASLRLTRSGIDYSILDDGESVKKIIQLASRYEKIIKIKQLPKV